MRTRIITHNGICRAQVYFKYSARFILAYYYILFVPCGILALLANFKKNIREMFFMGQWLEITVSIEFQKYAGKMHKRLVPGTRAYYNCMIHYYNRNNNWPEITQ